MAFDAAPGLDSEAGYCRHEALRKESHIGTKMGNFSFFSEEMADHWWSSPDTGGPISSSTLRSSHRAADCGQIRYPGRDANRRLRPYARHIKGVTRSLADTYHRHGVGAAPRDMAWIDVAPPSMSILENDGEPIIPMQYVPYNGGAVWEPWWERKPDRKRLLVSLGTVKPMVDGLELITWVLDSASEVDAEIILHLPANARSDLRSLPSNVRLVDWIPMGPS